MALPDQLFYNTGISTYFWIVTNRKSAERRGKVQLIDARELFTKMSKSLGEKRKEISPEQIAEIVRLHGDFTENERVKIFPNESFGFLRITVERPLRLRWEVTEDTLTVLRTHPKIVALPEEVRAALETGLNPLGRRGDHGRQAGHQTGGRAARRCRPTRKTPAESGPESLAVRDPNAPPVCDDAGNIEPDPEFRDYENVPANVPVCGCSVFGLGQKRRGAIHQRSHGAAGRLGGPGSRLAVLPTRHVTVDCGRARLAVDGL